MPNVATEHGHGDPNFPDGLSIVPNIADIGGDVLVADSTEDIATYGIAGRIWEGAEALRRYIESPSEESTLEFDPPCTIYRNGYREDNLSIVEVGAGAGYVSLHLVRSLALAPSTSSTSLSRVVMTDLPSVCPLMHRNAHRAQQAARQHTADLIEGEGENRGDYLFDGGIEVLVRQLAWGNIEHATALLSELKHRASSSTSDRHPRPLTHVLVSDCVYFPALLPPLLRALISLSSPYPMPEDSSGHSAHDESKRAPQVIVSYKVRSLVKEEPFWRAFGAWFSLEPVCCRYKTNNVKDKNSAGWIRFGEHPVHLYADRADGHTLDQKRTADSDDPYGDNVFVFVAERLPGTTLCSAPTDDGELMSGVRYQRVSEGGNGEEATSSIWRRDTSGTMNDAFELLLLGSISA